MERFTNANAAGAFSIDQSQYELLCKLNEFFYKHLLGLDYVFDFTNIDYDVLVVPCARSCQINNNGEEKESFSIDFDLIKSFNIDKDMTVYDYMSSNDKDLSEKYFIGKLKKQNEILLVKSVCADKTASSLYPNLKETFAHYFENNRGLPIVHELTQPIIELERFQKSDLSNTKISKTYKKMALLFISEHVQMYTVSVDMYKQIHLLPFLLHRINSLINTIQLKEMIELEINKRLPNCLQDKTGSWDKSLKFHKETKDESEKSKTKEEFNIKFEKFEETPTLKINNVIGINENVTLPNVYEILQCLTLKNSHETFDLERYEVMGDSFLKLTVALDMFCRFEATNEGNLTHLKSERVSNRYLYKLARDKQLESFILGEEFQIRKNWLPPNVCRKELDTQKLSDKSIADCVEALIGLYLVKSGVRAARGLLKWFDFKISKDIEFTIDFKLPEYASNLSLLNDLTEFEKLEEKLNYRFKNKTYLVQAFIHPSHINRDEIFRRIGSYQRLEFIGDSVLDFLITQYLFEDDEKQYSPGKFKPSSYII
jgi:dsRNA-specific ribonuclease